MARLLAPEELRAVCSPATLGFTCTDELDPLPGIVGQQRAVDALEFGLGIRRPHFHIFVAGPPGTGKTTAIRTFLEQRARTEAVPNDWCYVYNFEDPFRPRCLSLPPGRGRRFRRDMRQLVEKARREIPKAFEAEEYISRRERITQEVNRQREALFTRLSQHALERGFSIQATPVGFVILPLSKGRPLTDEEFLRLDPVVRAELQKRREEIEHALKTVLKEVRSLERQAEELIHALNREVALHVVGGIIEDLMETYADLPQVTAYLQAVREDMLHNLEYFFAPAQQPSAPQAPVSPQELALRRYEVNLLVDNSTLQGAPVVVEHNPNYPTLFGRLEKEVMYGLLQTDFTLIKPGALHHANGGYLVLSMDDLVRNPFSYESLKRALLNREIVTEDLVEHLGIVATKTIQPQPIPLDVKVIITGSPFQYYILYALDDEFRKVFKVRADFDSRMDRTPETERLYCAFLCTLAKREGLRHFTADAAAKMVEMGSRMAEDQRKLSARFGALADLAWEADYWAKVDGSPRVDAAHVLKAVEKKIYRSNLIEERLQEMIQRQVLLVETEGAKVGQVNGLSVVLLGDYAFGRPNRITASLGLGRAGLVDIEREARLGGPIHTKGVLILAGYLMHRFSQDKPLTLSARLVFEQSYEMVDGDSASSAELYALLSALADLPIKQGIAVTGSVNQRGEVQAVGGVNEKIEGFFYTCRLRGLTGEQGVIIPEANVQHLMLKEEVVEAVRQGKFHIWAVRTVDEGISILTGVPAGERGADGSFPPDTVNGRVDKRLREMNKALTAVSADGGRPSEAVGAPAETQNPSPS
ncbi:MAG: AAA family ATPase [Dehalococcoidia bacterium]|nr:AAA family ATPase [Dehalococcoidia bacterium]MDW8120068.1 ATP-binding protein [Chloroflexota bacterium]